MEERLQKILARCAGVSRRKAEELIADGRVRVNGNTASLGDAADDEEDVIEVDGVRLKKQPARISAAGLSVVSVWLGFRTRERCPSERGPCLYSP